MGTCVCACACVRDRERKRERREERGKEREKMLVCVMHDVLQVSIRSPFHRRSTYLSLDVGRIVRSQTDRRAEGNRLPFDVHLFSFSSLLSFFLLFLFSRDIPS
ncbi:hypothetical protein IE53DRAFT_74849 [Violaceomyces palustris]|uniref:Uncharacterized protein n=1 Tax=Violaceomyces palustris TaxID=1673888 RepID=A0ACD0NYK1_9BASI|nr:hypothetical protein IE53DRAFT_74849 [Violaceomyces palustris]